MKKSVSLLLCLSLLFDPNLLIYPYLSSDVHADSLPSFSLPAGVIKSEVSAQDLILEGMQVGKRFRGSNRFSSVVLIQDMHALEEAQLMNARAILQLAHHAGVRRVLMEGAIGKVETHFLGRYPSQKTRKYVGKAFVKEGYLSGAEYVGIESGNDLGLEIYGVEDKELYKKHFWIFREVRKKAENLKGNLGKVDKALEEEKSRKYTLELKELEHIQSRWADGQAWNIGTMKDMEGLIEKAISFSKDVKTLKMQWERFKPIHDLMNWMQSFDQQGLEGELKDLMMYFEKRLVNEDMKELVRGGLEFRLGRMGVVEYVGVLEKLFGGTDFSKRYPKIWEWKEMMLRHDGLQWEKVWESFELLLSELRRVLARQANLGEMVQRMDEWCLIKKLVGLELNRREWDAISGWGEPGKWYGRWLDRVAVIASFDGVKAWRSHEIVNLLETAVQFYQCAIERDEVIAANTLRQVEGSPANRTPIALIVGGFHTEGIQEILEKKGVGYVTWTPIIRGKVDGGTYERLMMDPGFEGSQNAKGILKMLALPCLLGNILKDLSRGQYEERKIAFMEKLIEGGIEEGEFRLVNEILNEWFGKKGSKGLEAWNQTSWEDISRLVKVLHRMYPEDVFLDLAELDLGNSREALITIRLVNKVFQDRYPGLAALTRLYFKRARGKGKLKRRAVSDTARSKRGGEDELYGGEEFLKESKMSYPEFQEFTRAWVDLEEVIQKDPGLFSVSRYFISLRLQWRLAHDVRKMMKRFRQRGLEPALAHALIYAFYNNIADLTTDDGLKAKLIHQFQSHMARWLEGLDPIKEDELLDQWYGQEE